MKKYNFRKVNIWTSLLALLCVAVMVIDTGMSIYLMADNDSSSHEVYTREIHNNTVEYADGFFDGDGSDLARDERPGVRGDDDEARGLFNILEILPTKRKGVMGYTISGCEPFELESLFNMDNLRVAFDNNVMSEEELRIACMDALVNPAPGTTRFYDSGNGPVHNVYEMDGNDSNNIPDYVRNLKEKLGESSMSPFELITGNSYTGYYKYVGEGNGVYSIANKSAKDNRPNDIVMVSKFYSNSDNSKIPTCVRKNDYIWVYTAELKSPADENDKNIYVENHKRIKYVNNNKFFTEIYPLEDIDKYKVSVVSSNPVDLTKDQIEAADLILMNSSEMEYYRYALNIYNKVKGKSLNEQNDRHFTQTNDISFENALNIYERVAVREDVAFVADKKCYDYYGDKTINTNVRKLMRMLFFIKTGNNAAGSGRRMFMDFLKRYVDNPGRSGIALRNDSRYKDSDGISRFVPPGLRGKSNGYMHEIHPYEPKADAITGSYYNEDGVLIAQRQADNGIAPQRPNERNWLSVYSLKKPDMFERLNVPRINRTQYDNGEFGYYKDEYNPSIYRYFLNVYSSMSNTTDYVYIDESNGNFVRDTKYSGRWYSMNNNSDNGGKYTLKQIEWEGKNQNEWPWHVETHGGIEGCLPDWFLCENGTLPYYDNDQERMLRSDLHLMFDYYYYGNYRAIKDIDSAGVKYENQTIVQENEMLKGDGGWVASAVENRTIKREDDDPGHREPSKQVYYSASLNIVNGDGVNKYSGNKVLYINEYEKDNTEYIPLKFKIRTSADIEKIEIYKDESASPIAIYNKDSSNNVKDTAKSAIKFNLASGSGRDNSFTMTNTTGAPELVPGSTADYMYSFEGKINKAILYSDISGANTSFKVKMWIKPVNNQPAISNNEKTGDDYREFSDELTVVIRDFFDLN